MGEIVVEMRAAGLTDDQIAAELGMQQEEIDRLSDDRGAPEQIGEPAGGMTAAWTPED